MNSDDKMAKKEEESEKRDGLVKELIERSRAKVNGVVNGNNDGEDSEDEEERTRRSIAKGKGKAREQ